MDDYKQTDKLFQEGADRHDFAYDPDAWAQMETMLDQDLNRRRWIRIGALLAVLLVGGLAFSYFSSNQHQDGFTPVQTEKEQTPDQVSDQEDVDSFGYQSSKAGNKSELDNEANSQSEQDSKTIQQAKQDDKLNSSSNQPSQLPDAVKPKAITTPTIVLAPATKSEAKQPTSGDVVNPTATANSSGTLSADPPVATNTSSPQNEASSEPESQEQPAATIRFYAASPLLQSHDFSLETPQVSMEIDRLAKPRARQKETAKPKRESTGGLVVAAGFGRVHGGGGDQNFSQGENRFGLEAEYRFGKKFGAKIGGYYGNVSYCAEGQDYTAKEGFWEAGVVAQRVEASCQVVEVPLLLSYYFNGNDRDGFFLNGGVTSYFLLKEDFKFDYEDPNHNGVKTWQEINTNRHLLGFGQFSVGYQQQVGKRTAMQVEAYTQLPLTGIGQGQVNLTNIGVTAKLLFDFRK